MGAKTGLFEPLGIVGHAQKVIYGDIVKAGEPDQHVRRDIPLSQFIIAVDLLGTVQKFGKLALLQVPVFPEIPYPTVHNITSHIGYHTAFCCIDKYCKMRYNSGMTMERG